MASDTQLLQPPFGAGRSADETADDELKADSDGGGQEAWQWPWRLWPFNNRALDTTTSAAAGGGAGGGGAGGGGAGGGGADGGGEGGGGAGGGGAPRSLDTSAVPETDRLSQMVARVLGGMLASGAFNTSVCAAGAAG